MLKRSHRAVLEEKQTLIAQLSQKEESEKQLRGSLEAINRKVQRWGEEYRVMVDERRDLEEKYQQVQLKYEQKREKHAREKEEWASIFKELMREVDKLKREIGRFQKAGPSMGDSPESVDY